MMTRPNKVKVVSKAILDPPELGLYPEGARLCHYRCGRWIEFAM